MTKGTLLVVQGTSLILLILISYLLFINNFSASFASVDFCEVLQSKVQIHQQ